MSETPSEPQIADSPLDLIGNTPLLRLSRVTAGLTCPRTASSPPAG
ncbi:hypothetical protein BH18ACT4_BH18ACT4_13200 [soil metagenome]